MNVKLDKSANKHGILPVTGRCYGCGVKLRYVSQHRKTSKYYCSRNCMFRKPPKMALAELYHSKPFPELAVEHFKRGGTVQALADMCGVHKQALYEWLRRCGIERTVKVRVRGALDRQRVDLPG